MKRFATALVALSVLATGAANAAGMGTTHESPDASVPQKIQAENPVQVPARDVLSTKELNRRGIAPEALITVSDFSVTGPRSYER